MATHMIYFIQAIFHVLVQKMTLTLHCDALVKTTYSNMGFAIYDNFNKSIIQYFGLCSDYKNSSEHMNFSKTKLIDTTRYVYEMRTFFEYDNIPSIISSSKHVNIILNFIKNEKLTPFEDGGIKPWHIPQVNTQKGSSILQKCQNVFKKFISGTYCLGELMNKSWQHMKMTQRLERQRVLLKNSVLLYIMNSVEIKFT